MKAFAPLAGRMCGAALHRATRWPELVVLPVLGVLLIYVFDAHATDLQVMDWLHTLTPQVVGTNAWPVGQQPWIKWFNDHFITLMTWCAALTSALLITIGCAYTRHRACKTVGLFFLISLLLGPGLLVNGIFKTQWGRPRPADITRYGGEYTYRHPLDPGQGGKRETGGQGRSFPSGHAAAAFWTTALFFLARLWRPRWAGTVLCATLGFGLLAGALRVVAGRHFPSDIAWAGVLTFSSNWLVFYVLLRCPQTLLQQDQATQYSVSTPILAGANRS